MIGALGCEIQADYIQVEYRDEMPRPVTRRAKKVQALA